MILVPSVGFRFSVEFPLVLCIFELRCLEISGHGTMSIYIRLFSFWLGHGDHVAIFYFVRFYVPPCGISNETPGLCGVCWTRVIGGFIVRWGILDRATRSGEKKTTNNLLVVVGSFNHVICMEESTVTSEPGPTCGKEELSKRTGKMIPK